MALVSLGDGLRSFVSSSMDCTSDHNNESMSSLFLVFKPFESILTHLYTCIIYIKASVIYICVATDLLEPTSLLDTMYVSKVMVSLEIEPPERQSQRQESTY